MGRKRTSPLLVQRATGASSAKELSLVTPRRAKTKPIGRGDPAWEFVN